MRVASIVFTIAALLPAALVHGQDGQVAQKYCNNCKWGPLLDSFYWCKCKDPEQLNANQKRNYQRICENAQPMGKNFWFKSTSDCQDNNVKINPNRLKIFMCNECKWAGQKGVWTGCKCQAQSKLSDIQQASYGKICNWCKLQKDKTRHCDCEPNIGTAPWLCNDCKWDAKNQIHWGCDCKGYTMALAHEDNIDDYERLCKTCEFKPRMDGKPWKGHCDCSEETPEPTEAPEPESACAEYCGEGVTWDPETQTCVGECDASQEWPGCGILGGLPNKEASVVAMTAPGVADPCGCETACRVIESKGWFYDKDQSMCECFSSVEFDHEPGMKENFVIGVVQ